LKKIQLQNIQKRDKGIIHRFFINEEGGLRFDPSCPTPKRRIQALEESLFTAQKQIKEVLNVDCLYEPMPILLDGTYFQYV
jgi:hypothetical protein